MAGAFEQTVSGCKRHVRSVLLSVPDGIAGIAGCADRRACCDSLLWPEVLEWAPFDGVERKLALNLLPLPIDQRCGREEMERIARAVEDFYS